MEFKELRKKASSLPQRPGVYQMKDASGQIIYVGKAKRLKNRVLSYFINPGSHGLKTEMMLLHVQDFDVVITSNEWEALVLENTMIKHNMPRYNIKLKDDKGYPYIRMSYSDPYISMSIMTDPLEDDARYFGPYSGRTVAHEVVRTVAETFRLPTCRRKFPRDIGKGRPCLNHQIGRCVGVCAGYDYGEYRQLVDEAVMLLEGRYDQLAKNVQAEMESAAENMEFERAAKLRDRLRAITKIGSRQKVVAAKAPDTDIVGLYTGPVKSAAAVLHYMDGTLFAKDVQMMDAADESEARDMMDEFLREFYQNAVSIPQEIVCWPEATDAELLSRYLSEAAGRTVKVRGPGRDRKKFTNMAVMNAKDEAERMVTARERQSKMAETFCKMLSLDTPPVRIEAYDISNTAGSETVGAMVVFENGKPKKTDYRKFKIYDLAGQDDYASMAQVLGRRFKNYLEGDERFNAMPDLLLIDGGLGHVHAAKAVLDELGIKCPVWGMVKDSKHRTRALIGEDGAEVGISANPQVYAFIGTIQEEAHRFAITYHRNIRDKKDLRSELDSIPGVGPARRAKLLETFKSVGAIKELSLEALGAAVPKNVAQAVYSYFHSEGE